MSDDLIKALMAAAGKQGKQHNFTDFKTQAEAKKHLLSFLPGGDKHTKLKPGDFIQRNAIGKERYKYPKENHCMMIVEVYDKYRFDEDGTSVNALCVCSLHPELPPAYYELDLNFYEPLQEKAANVFSLFSKKKDNNDE